MPVLARLAASSSSKTFNDALYVFFASSTIANFPSGSTNYCIAQNTAYSEKRARSWWRVLSKNSTGLKGICEDTLCFNSFTLLRIFLVLRFVNVIRSYLVKWYQELKKTFCSSTSGTRKLWATKVRQYF
ncbi:hypothetical protein PMIN03_004537 [Paraphaeosphaeria minitans]